METVLQVSAIPTRPRAVDVVGARSRPGSLQAVFQPLLHDLEAVAMPRRSVDHVIGFADLGSPNHVTRGQAIPLRHDHTELVAEKLHVLRCLLHQFALPSFSLHRQDSDRQDLGLVDQDIAHSPSLISAPPIFLSISTSSGSRFLTLDVGCVSIAFTAFAPSPESVSVETNPSRSMRVLTVPAVPL